MARHIRRAATGGMIALMLTVPLVFAQSAAEPAGPPVKAVPRLVLTLGTGLTHDDNQSLSPTAPDAVTTLDSRFGLAFNTATHDQALSFSIGGLLRAETGNKVGNGAGGGGLRFRDPSADLKYRRDGADSRLTLTGLFRRAPVDLFEPQVASDGTASPTDVIVTDGTITTKTAGVTFETGLSGPLGFDLAGNYSGRSYSDTSDPDVFDSTSSRLSGGVHLRMASGDMFSLTALGTEQEYQNADQTSRRSHNLSFGYSRNLRPDLRLTAALGYGEATSRRAGGVTDRSSGLIGSLELERSLSNGVLSFTLAGTRDPLGARQSLSFGRSLTLRTGSLAATVGLAARDGGDAQVVGSLSYAHKLPRDSFGIEVSREVSLNGDNADVANTVLAMTYQHQLSEVSAFSVSLKALATGSGGAGTVTDVARQTLRATYSHDLAADWQLTTGYQYRHLDSSTTGTADSNSLFLTINRKFTLLP